ncbi:MAG: polyhydroxyalkanoate synthesis repressor PhaR [Zoogloeaceae bacterium]|jgi:polyhydroxyalkanoate synthesis repressor PhaR|nr:polyhydroxyalkanoate synthesis repressor PhaR [Zoogloeaceae bacterium]
MEAQIRIIKKYPNRRLYDTQTSAYITLSEVKELVLGFEAFQVVDAKSGKDLTRSILLQIILEEESAGIPIFSSELLSMIIRFYGNAMQSMLGKYLENNLQSFVEFQHTVQDQVLSLYEGNPRQQNELWSQLLNFQQPDMQGVMSTYMGQSQSMLRKIQAQLQAQARSMLGTGYSAELFPPPRAPKNPAQETPALTAEATRQEASRLPRRRQPLKSGG